MGLGGNISEKGYAGTKAGAGSYNKGKQAISMSVSVIVRTKKSIEPMEMLGQLAKKGMGVAVTSKEFPSVKFGILEKSIRGVEVNEDENGYEIRICIFASKEDYELFANTISVVMEMTGGKAYCEDDDEDEGEDPIERFNAVWAEKTLEWTFMATRAMVHSNGAQIVVSGLLCDLCIGPRMYNWFKIPLTGEYPKEDVESLWTTAVAYNGFAGTVRVRTQRWG